MMDCCEDRVVCPKPRRRVAPPNLNTPSRFHVRYDAESNDGAELLGLILGQNEAEGGSWSPPFSFGSPPCRTQNPLVQDADFGTFIHDETSAEQFDHGREKLGKKQAAAARFQGF